MLRKIFRKLPFSVQQIIKKFYVYVKNISAINDKENHGQEKEVKNISTDLLIIDNFEPSFLKAGFRVEEINFLLKNIENSILLTMSTDIYQYSNWQIEPRLRWNHPMSYEEYSRNRLEYCDKYSELDNKLLFMNEVGNCNVKSAYILFLYNAYISLKFLEEKQIPFVFILYPGGGFGLNSKFSDHMLRTVCSSSMFRGCYCTQKIAYNYLIERKICETKYLYYHYGGGLFQTEEIKQKIIYPINKKTIDIAFVAFKTDYNEFGMDKGYDLFILTARYIIKKYPYVHFHNVGTHGKEGFEYLLDGLDDNFHFYGKQEADFFPEFYAKIDILLSPNRPFYREEGSFDGFPLGVEASFHGALLVLSDPLNINTEYIDNNDFILIDTSEESIIKKIEYLINHPDLIYNISREGQLKTQQLFDINKQKDARLTFIEKHLGLQL